MKSVNQLAILLLATSASSLFNACKPNDNVNTAADAATFTAHLSSNKSTPTMATLDDALGGIVKGPNGSYIKFLPNCFNDAAGNDVTGNVTITYLDASKAGDMFYNKLLPISGTDNLFSGGEYKVTASQNDKPVYLKPFMNTEAIFASDNKDVSGMMFFKGVEVLNNPNTIVNWINSKDSSSTVLVFNGDSIDISGDSLGFANADRFIANPNYVDCSFTVNGATISQNTFTGMCIYKDFKGFWPLNINTSNQLNGTHIPSGILVHYVLFGLYNNKFYRGVIRDINTTQGTNYTIELTEADPLTNKAWLNNL
jgi:hypothetical protein